LEAAAITAWATVGTTWATTYKEKLWQFTDKMDGSRVYWGKP
jgi:hypothetical protein